MTTGLGSVTAGGCPLLFVCVCVHVPSWAEERQGLGRSPGILMRSPSHSSAPAPTIPVTFNVKNARKQKTKQEQVQSRVGHAPKTTKTQVQGSKASPAPCRSKQAWSLKSLQITNASTPTFITIRPNNCMKNTRNWCGLGSNTPSTQT